MKRVKRFDTFINEERVPIQSDLHNLKRYIIGGVNSLIFNVASVKYKLKELNIDKYKITLQVKIKYDKVQNKATIYLYDEEAGVVIGTHRLEYDYLKENYRYFYLERLIVNSCELEDIFK